MVQRSVKRHDDGISADIFAIIVVVSVIAIVVSILYIAGQQRNRNDLACQQKGGVIVDLSGEGLTCVKEFRIERF